MKVKNWERKLTEFIQARRKRRFKWGKDDCALFAADCVKHITGVDYAEEFRGKYSDEKGAKSVLIKEGKGTLLKTIDTKLIRYSSALLASRGDVVYYKGALGICGGGSCYFYSHKGITNVPIINIKIAWKVI